MGHTNSTVNYNLPQFVGSDKPSWLGDVNGAFLAIDTAIAAAKSQADSAAGGVTGLQTVVGGHTTQIGTLTDTVTAQGGTLNAVTALIGNGTPTTTDQTIIGAINELAAVVEAGEVSVTADGVQTWKQLLDTLYAAIDGGKVTKNAKLSVIAAGVEKFYSLLSNRQTSYEFFNVYVGGGNIILEVIQPGISSNYSQKTEGQTISYLNSTVATSGTVIKITY